MSSSPSPALSLKQTLSAAQIGEAVVPKEVFDQHMLSMKFFYTSERAPTHPYALPFSVSNRTTNSGILVIGPPHHLVTAKEKLQVIADQYKTTATRNLQRLQTSMDSILTKLNADKDLAGFDAALEQQRKQAIADATANINASYQGVSDAVHGAGGDAALGLAAAQKIGQANASIMGSISRFMKAILSTVIAAVKAAVAWLAQAAQDVANWVAGAVNTVVNFLGSLF